MTALAMHHPLIPTHRQWLVVLFVISATSLTMALFFQYKLGLEPCILCLYQRVPYIALMVFCPLGLLAGRHRRDVLYSCAVTLYIGGIIALYHTGIEYGFWDEAFDCVVTEASNNVEQLLQSLQGTPQVDCAVIPWTLFGISMAGYNTLLSFGLGMATFYIASLKR